MSEPLNPERVTADRPSIPDGPIEAVPVGFRPTGEQAVLLRELLTQAGVELGGYDQRIVEWLAGLDWPTFAPIASWIKRAAKLP